MVFLDVLETFNNNQSLDTKWKNEVIQYFDYRWKHNLNSTR
jgi:5-methylcytosine-specific restriction endonuclease McrBC GTP-binding regulatory subunit McrB